MSNAAIDADPNIIDFKRGLAENQEERLVIVDTIASELITSAEEYFRRHGDIPNEETVDASSIPSASKVYEHKDFPGQIHRSILT